MLYRSCAHRPCLSVFGNSNRAQAMFGLTMVTGYPGQSGHCVQASEIDKSVVVRWAYVKELAVVNMGRDGDKGFIRSCIGVL